MIKYQQYHHNLGSDTASPTFSGMDLTAMLYNAKYVENVVCEKYRDELNVAKNMMAAYQAELAALQAQGQVQGHAECQVCRTPQTLLVAAKQPAAMRCACKETMAACFACWSKSLQMNNGYCPFCNVQVAGHAELGFEA